MDNSLLAQSIKINGQPIQGPLKDINNLGDLINRILTFVMPLAIIILFLVFVWGGYEFLLSRGNAEKIKSAKAKLTTGVIGFILLFVSYLVVKVVAFMFGLGEGII